MQTYQEKEWQYESSKQQIDSHRGHNNNKHFPDRNPHVNQLQDYSDWANSSQKVTQLKAMQQLADTAPVQRFANNTGLPDNLKSGIENLSGYSMNDVKVHYNSDKPTQLNAHAYAQGSAIHLAAGQEKHLPHEAWHVVQQKQGRVQPTRQLKGKVAINDDAGLEKEADVMGAKALNSGMKIWDGGLINLSGNGLVTQRAIDNAKYDEDSKHLDTVKGFFLVFDRAVANAFDFVTSVPSLGAYAGLNGYMRLWVEKWNEYLKNGTPKLLAATFGYVIETLVSDRRSEFFPGDTPGYKILTQVTVGSTRPDLVLAEKSGTHVAWLDITAANSVDHIFNKDGWDDKVSMYAESSYPSLDPGYLSLMKQNKDNKGKLNNEEIQKRLIEARKAYGLQKEVWEELGLHYTKKNLSGNFKFSRMSANLNPGLLQNFIRDTLMTDFNVGALEMKMVPSILLAMGVGPGAWGFNTGFSGSVKAGEAWLIDNPLPNKEVKEVVMIEID